eukprot:m.34071 g.34071  ORF g.34071 m.34071 type:complete len:310 (-) comp10612_c0_seq1:176-1105(-)
MDMNMDALVALMNLDGGDENDESLLDFQTGPASPLDSGSLLTFEAAQVSPWSTFAETASMQFLSAPSNPMNLPTPEDFTSHASVIHKEVIDVPGLRNGVTFQDSNAGRAGPTTEWATTVMDAKESVSMDAHEIPASVGEVGSPASPPGEDLALSTTENLIDALHTHSELHNVRRAHMAICQFACGNPPHIVITHSAAQTFPTLVPATQHLMPEYTIKLACEVGSVQGLRGCSAGKKRIQREIRRKAEQAAQAAQASQGAQVETAPSLTTEETASPLRRRKSMKGQTTYRRRTSSTSGSGRSRKPTLEAA